MEFDSFPGLDKYGKIKTEYGKIFVFPDYCLWKPDFLSLINFFSQFGIFLNSEKFSELWDITSHISFQKQKTECVRCKLRIQKKKSELWDIKKKKSQNFEFISRNSCEDKKSELQDNLLFGINRPFHKISKIKNFYDWMNSRHIFSLRQKKERKKCKL